jgi:KaiC/GvpD/RAD55 family RecA-like ATPase
VSDTGGALERVPSGIAGLDTILRGGFLKAII